MRSPKITSSRTVAAVADTLAKNGADPLTAARSRVDALKAQIAERNATRGKVNSTASDLQRQAQAAQADHNELQADDIIAGKPPRAMPRETAELIRQARQVAGSTPAALEKLEREGAALSAQLADAQAAFNGAVFNYVRERQRTAQGRITDALAAVAPDLAELLALNEVQSRYCGGQQTLKLKQGDSAPWSGAVVVKNFTDRLPLQFKSSAIGLLELAEQSADVVKEIAAEIEGDI